MKKKPFMKNEKQVEVAISDELEDLVIQVIKHTLEEFYVSEDGKEGGVKLLVEEILNYKNKNPKRLFRCKILGQKIVYNEVKPL